MTLKKRSLLIAIILALPCALYGAKGEVEEKIGNFHLPTSQQPGPLFGFGQNIVDKGDTQIFIYPTQTGGKHQNFTLLYPSFLYGISDRLSFFLMAPITVTSKEGCNRAAGMGDMLFQLEYAAINLKGLGSEAQITILGNIGIPTGSTAKNPSTGFGSASFFLGFTSSYSTEYWYAWLQAATTLTTKKEGVKPGNIFYYEAGIEYCFWAHCGWIFAGMIEFLGGYEQRSKEDCITDCDSGGHELWIGPSLWASSEKFIFQLGVAVPAVQHLFGNQNKNYYSASAGVSYKFN